MLSLSRLRIGLLSSSASSIGGGGSFYPLSLFAAGEPGAWYDPSDLSTMFQDTAGTTPVTATGQTVGLLLDKSQGLVLGPELVTNGDFSSGTTGWTTQGSTTISAVSGAMVVNQPVAGTWFSENVRLVTPVLTIGKFYKIEFDARNTSGTNSLRLANNATVILDMPTINATFQRFTAIFQCTVTNTFSFFKNGLTGTFELDNISVKELPGNHATQATAASRPIYGIEPFGGRRNLLSWTEQFDNAAWTKIAVTANGTEIRETTANSNHIISQNVSLTGTYTFSLELQAVGRDVYTIWMGTSSGTFAFIYTFSTNTITSVGTALSNVTATVLSGGWVRFTGNVVTPNRFQVSVGTPGSIYAGDPANGFNIRNAQLELGSTATAYQRVTDQWNVTQAGVPSVSYLAFDGTDDFLLTGTITPGIDKAQVFAGVRKLSDNNSIIAETSANSGANQGSFALLGSPYGGAGSAYASNLNGSQRTSFDATPFAAPTTNILTSLFDIAGANRSDEITFRVNGTTPTLTGGGNANAGTSNFLAYPLYIGRRGGSTLPFNGRIYQMLVRFGANLSAATITQTESYTAGKTGIYTVEQLIRLNTLNASGVSYNAYAAADSNGNNYPVTNTVLAADGTPYSVL